MGKTALQYFAIWAVIIGLVLWGGTSCLTALSGA